MNCFGLIKFVTGILLALALLFLGGAAAARYLITRLTTPPPKPVFVEEQTTPDADAETASEPTAEEGGEATANSEEGEETEPLVFNEPDLVDPPAEEGEAEVEQENAASETAEDEEDQETESQPNARITQPIGMVLRQGPSQDTTRIGGLYYNDEIIVIGESADGQWQNVRLPGSGVEGWIKSGNTERLN